MRGRIIIGIEGVTLTSADRERLEHPAVGGVILFARNYAEPEQLEGLIAQIRQVREPPLLITVDQEGGSVQRFQEGLTRLPSPGWLGLVYDLDPPLGERLARLAGWVMAAELRARDVDLSWAPVLDLDRGISAVIAERSFHAEPEAVAALARSWCCGAYAAGMSAVGKHYPGHGTVAADSHDALPCDTRPLAEIARGDLVPFQHLAARGLPAVMTAHVVYPEVDDRPATVSPRWIGDILRGRLGFRGAAISDDLGMSAAATIGSLAERVAASLEAGCDGVLVCDPDAAGDVLERLGRDDGNGGAALRLARLYGRRAPSPTELRASSVYREAVQELIDGVPNIGTPE